MNVVFLGNHTVGVRTLAAILETERVTGVVAHPPDPEDGTRYQSVFAYAQERGLNAARLAGRDARLLEFIKPAQPDLLWIADYRYLIPPEPLALAQLLDHPQVFPVRLRLFSGGRTPRPCCGAFCVQTRRQRLEVVVSVEVSPDSGAPEQRFEETRIALRELGLNDDIKMG